MIVAEISRLVGQPAPRTLASDAWSLRRLRLVARRRVRVEIAAFADRSTMVADDELTLRLETVSSGDPRVIAWNANRTVDLVVVHDGCGARVVGEGGRSGVIELPGALEPEAFLSFCYDTDPGSPRV